MIIFSGDPLDVYIHWLILILGIAVLLSGVAVFTSCRSFAGAFKLLAPEKNGRSSFYQQFYKHHSLYWTIFGYALAIHLLVTITHIGLPSSANPFNGAHQVVLVTAITNGILVLGVLTSCRSFARALEFFMKKSPLTNNVYKSFYMIHSYLWWVLAASLGLHIVFGMIHAVNT